MSEYGCQFIPALTRCVDEGVAYYTDEILFSRFGIRVGFTERWGGISYEPYASLNLATHVGDDFSAVSTNRTMALRALHIPKHAIERLVYASQVHDIRVANIRCDEDLSSDPLPDTDALATNLEDTPLLLCFADCVPIILVSPNEKVISVVHSGWRGTLDEIAYVAAKNMIETYSCNPAEIVAYIGPYIGPENFEVSAEIGSQFADKFGTFDEAFQRTKFGSGTAVRFDLSRAVTESLLKAGVNPCNIANLGMCTVEHVDRFFSYRAENGVTGRIGAIACIM